MRAEHLWPSGAGSAFGQRKALDPARASQEFAESAAGFSFSIDPPLPVSELQAAFSGLTAEPKPGSKFPRKASDPHLGNIAGQIRGSILPIRGGMLPSTIWAIARLNSRQFLIT